MGDGRWKMEDGKWKMEYSFGKVIMKIRRLSGIAYYVKGFASRAMRYISLCLCDSVVKTAGRKTILSINI